MSSGGASGVSNLWQGQDAAQKPRESTQRSGQPAHAAALPLSIDAGL
jgi:hypothetical protein